MTTAINTPPNRDGGDSGAGWVVVVIILLAIIGVGAYLWVRYQRPAAPANGTNINVTLPKDSGASPAATP